jgi:hypothetical protein
VHDEPRLYGPGASCVLRWLGQRMVKIVHAVRSGPARGLDKPVTAGVTSIQSGGVDVVPGFLLWISSARVDGG